MCSRHDDALLTWPSAPFALACHCMELVRAAGSSENPARGDHEPPELLGAAARMTSHDGQKKILLTITHEAATRIKAWVAIVRHGLRLIQEIAPQLDKPQRGFALVRCIVERLLNCGPKPNLGLTAWGSR